MRTVTAVGVMLVNASVTLIGTNARAGEREACVTAAEKAQSLRDDGKYTQARKEFLLCVRDVCPAAVKRDCVEWLNQLESVAPTVVLLAKDGSRDLVDVKVTIDGALATEKLDGTPLPIDPGAHTFRFEWSGKTTEERVVIGAGQKSRNIIGTFATTPEATPAVAPPPPPKARPGSVVPALVVGGVGLAGLTSFAIFGIAGAGDKSDLARSCKPHCTQGEVDSVRTKFIIADISLGVGLVGLGVSTYMILKRPRVEVDGAVAKTGLPSVAVDLAPTSGGVAGSFRTAF